MHQLLAFLSTTQQVINNATSISIAKKKNDLFQSRQIEWHLIKNFKPNVHDEMQHNINVFRA